MEGLHLYYYHPSTLETRNIFLKKMTVEGEYMWKNWFGAQLGPSLEKFEGGGGGAGETAGEK